MVFNIGSIFPVIDFVLAGPGGVLNDDDTAGIGKCYLSISNEDIVQLGRRSKGDSFCVIMLTTDFGSSQPDHQIYTKVGICVVGV